MEATMTETSKSPTRDADPVADQDIMDVIGNDSFPASDPPAWPTTGLGAPSPCGERDHASEPHAS